MQTEKKLTVLSSSIRDRARMILGRSLTVERRSLSWFSTIDFLPVRNFYKIVETGDRRWLLKGIDYENLPECKVDFDPIWEKIWDQFIEISNDRDYQIYFETVRKLAVVENKYEILKAELFSLYFRCNPEHIQDLEAEGIIITTADRESYLKSLDAGVNKLRSFTTKIKLLQKELKARMKAGTKSNFEDLVESVERYRGLPINIDTLSIKQFALMLNKIKKENVKRSN